MTYNKLIRDIFEKEYLGLLRSYGTASDETSFRITAARALGLANAVMSNSKDSGENSLQGLTVYTSDSVEEFFEDAWPTLAKRLELTDVALPTGLDGVASLAPILHEKGLILLIKSAQTDVDAQTGVLILDTNLASGDQILGVLFLIGLERMFTAEDASRLKTLIEAAQSEDTRPMAIRQMIDTVLESEEASAVNAGWSAP